MFIALSSSLVLYANAEREETQTALQITPQQAVPLPKDWLDTTPVHNERKLVFYLNDFVYRCKECHRDFNTVIRSHLPFGAHKDMAFNHGLNLRCYNCHNFKNLETYVDFDGSEIPNNKPVLHNPHQPHFPRLVPRPPPSQARIPHFEKGSHHE